ncbi:MAG: glutathione S-transferase family protein [Betaproteobacteria bacterium]|nr:MAG: glutathione S-transferase family protein [Betaproteobacteria bacterium]
MKLYITDTSPYARIARIVVLEKGLERQVEMIHAQTRTPGSPYYKINPSGRVPYLVRDDGVAMEDSAVICRYLDHLTGPRLFDLPSGEDEWEALRLQALAGSLLEGVSVWVRELKRPADEQAPSILAHELNRSERMIDLWEDQISHPLMRGKLTMGQIALITALQLELQLPGFNWRPGHPKLNDWANWIGERPSIKATLPSKH